MPNVLALSVSLMLALTCALQTPAKSPSMQPARLERADQSGAEPHEAGVSIHVVSNDWHTGIVVARPDMLPGTLPEVEDFPRAPYLEFSWGDAEYFPSREKGLGLAMGAALTPTPAVIHLAGLPAHPRKVFPGAEIVPLRLSANGFRDLLRYLDGAFARGGAPRVASSAPGLYRFSRFYPATGTFHLFNTCNTWTARGLASAGLPVRVAGVVRAEDLMAQLRSQGQRRRPEPSGSGD